MTIALLRKGFIVRTICITFIAFGVLTIALAGAITFRVVRAIYDAHGAEQATQPAIQQSDQSGATVVGNQAQQGRVETGNLPAGYGENPYYIKHSERIQIAINSLLLLVIFWQLIAIATQAYIYHRQRKLMHKQWIAMRRSLMQAKQQTKIAGDALQINAQAYVCVRDIQLDLVKDRIFIEIENLGKVPASSIEVEVWLEVRGLSELGIKGPAPFHRVYKYGKKTELLSGNLPINIRIPHDQWLQPDHVGNIKSGVGALIAEGLITFYEVSCRENQKEITLLSSIG